MCTWIMLMKRLIYRIRNEKKNTRNKVPWGNEWNFRCFLSFLQVWNILRLIRRFIYSFCLFDWSVSKSNKLTHQNGKNSMDIWAIVTLSCIRWQHFSVLKAKFAYKLIYQWWRGMVLAKMTTFSSISQFKSMVFIVNLFHVSAVQLHNLEQTFILVQTLILCECVK